MKLKKIKIYLMIFIAFCILGYSSFHFYRIVDNALHYNEKLIQKKTEKVIKYVHDELIYTPYLTFTNASPDNEHKWQALYVKNGMLYKNNHLVFKKSFYKGHKLSIHFLGYIRSKSRIDFKYEMEGKYDYAQKQTLELLKFKLKNHLDTNLPDSTELYNLDINENQHNKIYYYKE
ncbi:hypothetical protein [Kandleria vitulina]|uniref:hypothetical protein n=1 Tax=Kandleria vitulina TaxID=1630 RepID=UPI00048E5221|nr:hypothetical protein [Kandleria vitulina]